MIGKNRIVLNQASMNEAAQLWIDKYITSKPKVIDIEEGNTAEWVITVEGKGETINDLVNRTIST